jgi:hypothetical protein
MKLIIKSLLFCTLIARSILFADELFNSPVQISNPGQNAESPSITIDSFGNTIILWVENEAVFSRTADTEGNWSDPETISGGSASAPLIGADRNGNALAIWLEGGIVKSRVKSADQGWSATTTSLSQSGASSQMLSLDSSGNVAVVWLLSNQVQGVTGTVGGGWGSVATISASGASSPDVAVDSSGNAVCVWMQGAESSSNIYSSSLASGGNWSTPTMISASGDNCISPRVEFSHSSNEKAISLWFSYEEASGYYSNVYAQAASLGGSGSWTTPIKLSSPGQMDPNLLNIGLVIDNNGNATAMWTNAENGSMISLQFSSKPANGSWAAAQLLIPQDPLSFSFGITSEDEGSVLAAWMQLDQDSGNLVVQAAVAPPFLTSQLMWGPYATISDGGSNGYPCVAMNCLSNHSFIAACWLSYDSSIMTIQAATGGYDEPLPPSGLSVEQAETNYGLLTEVYNTLSWEASPTVGVAGYLIYRNGTYVDNVSVDQLVWVDFNRIADQSVSYGVQAITSTREVSSIAQINWP